jgi:hypothetical protein
MTTKTLDTGNHLRLILRALENPRMLIKEETEAAE